MSTLTECVLEESTPRRPTHERPDRIRRLALLGCGTVGSAVARTLLEHGGNIALAHGVDLRLQRILVRSSRPRRHIPRGLVTDEFDAVLASSPDIVIEAMGGVEPARSHIAALLDRGISVVTANKSVVSRFGDDLAARARRSGAGFAFEAAVCAGVPVLATLRQLQGDRIRSIRGIVNGSVNYILTRMTESGCPLETALDEARGRGLVEPDPAADLSGRDSAEKLAILAAASGHGPVAPESIPTTGIESIDASDILWARRRGYLIRLLVELESRSDGLRLRVGPTLVPKRHRLASIRLEQNAVLIDAALGGEILLAGPGAGPAPTTSAILGDVLRIVNERGMTRQVASGLGRSTSRAGNGDRPWYIRMTLGRGESAASLVSAWRSEGVGVRQIESEGRIVRALIHRASAETVGRVCGGGRYMPVLEAPSCAGGVESTGRPGAFRVVHQEEIRRSA